MSQISRRRADQLGDLMLHLKFAAVHPQQVLFAAMKDIRQSFHSAGLTGSRGAKKQEDSRWPSLRRHPGSIHLHVRNNFGDRMGLADQAVAKLLRKFFPPIRRKARRKAQ